MITIKYYHPLFGTNSRHGEIKLLQCSALRRLAASEEAHRMNFLEPRARFQGVAKEMSVTPAEVTSDFYSILLRKYPSTKRWGWGGGGLPFGVLVHQ